MSLDALKAARDVLTTVVAENNAIVARHQDALGQVDAAVASLEAEAIAEAKRIPTVADLKSLVDRLPG